MMKKISSWISSNRVLFIIVVLVSLVLLKNLFFGPGVVIPLSNSVAPGSYSRNMAISESTGFAGDMTYDAKIGSSPIMPPMPPDYGGSTDVSAQNRKVITESNLSLLVKDVRQTIDEISNQVTGSGGFVVNSSVNQPNERGSGNIALRVPSDRVDETLAFLRSQSVRVVSENVYGRDVTDQYQDLESRLQTLENTKRTFESMLSSATTVEQILKVQQSIFNVQDQIDSIKGQQKYLEETSSSTLINVYLSTDELALPYSPADPWRPQVVFKTAVRSLVANVRDIANLLIWGVVYLPLIAVGIVVIYLANRMLRKK